RRSCCGPQDYPHHRRCAPHPERVLSRETGEPGAAAQRARGESLQLCCPPGLRCLALVSEFPISHSLRRPAHDQGGRRQSKPRRDPWLERRPPALSRPARDWYDPHHRPLSLYRDRRTRGEEAELELQRPRQRYVVRALLLDGARLSAP